MSRAVPVAFGVNTYSYTLTHSVTECVDHLAGRGISRFELMAAPGHIWPSEMTSAARRALRSRMSDGGLELVSVNMPSLDINLAAAAPEMRCYCLDLMADLVELAGDLGAGQVLLGPGKANPLYSPPREQLVERFFAALDVLCPLARDVGTSLLVENIPICFAPDAQGLMKLLDEYGNDDLNIVYDVANGFFLGEDILASLRHVRDRLRLVHLSDTHRSTWRHDAVGLGSVPFSAVPPVLEEIGHHTAPVLEVISYDGDAAIFGSIEQLGRMGWGNPTR